MYTSKRRKLVCHSWPSMASIPEGESFHEWEGHEVQRDSKSGLIRLVGASCRSGLPRPRLAGCRSSLMRRLVASFLCCTRMKACEPSQCLAPKPDGLQQGRLHRCTFSSDALRHLPKNSLNSSTAQVPIEECLRYRLQFSAVPHALFAEKHDQHCP